MLFLLGIVHICIKHSRMHVIPNQIICREGVSGWLMAWQQQENLQINSRRWDKWSFFLVFVSLKHGEDSSCLTACSLICLKCFLNREKIRLAILVASFLIWNGPFFRITYHLMGQLFAAINCELRNSRNLAVVLQPAIELYMQMLGVVKTLEHNG